MNAAEFATWLQAPSAQPLVMGILNITPDSFSDGGQFTTPEDALAQARRMLAEGADLLDIGGESTRPGATRVSAADQIARIVPIIQAIRAFSQVAISVDTTLTPVAQAAVAAGANILNDISAGQEDPNLLPFAAARQLPVILMHMQGEPRTMQSQPVYQDVTAEVCHFLRQRAAAAIAAGIAPHRIILDPGIGFGKTTRHNLQLMHDLPRLCSLGHRVLLGVSRKRFIGEITGVTQPADRVYGSTAAVFWAITNGVQLVRVHDVGPTVQTIKMLRAII